MTNEGYDLASAVLIFLAAAIPTYFSFRLQNYLRGLMVSLSIFTLIHGMYHVLEVLHYKFLAENVVEPLSYAVLAIFGLLYLRRKITQKAKI